MPACQFDRAAHVDGRADDRSSPGVPAANCVRVRVCCSRCGDRPPEVLRASPVTPDPTAEPPYFGQLATELPGYEPDT